MSSQFGSGQKFVRTYALADFGVTADVTCQPSQYNLVGTVTVPAQQMVTYGANDVINGGLTGQACYILLDNTSGTALNGVVRLTLSNATGTNEIVVYEGRTERLSADTSDRTKAVLLPEYPVKARQDSKLLVRYKPDGSSAVTISATTNTKFIIPVTVYQ